MDESNTAGAATAMIARVHGPADYLTHKPIIDGVVQTVCRKARLRSEDADDFTGHVHLHLVENDFHVLRRYERRSSLRTYLLVVVQRLYQDWRNARWGKWRPSAEARRLGPVAVQFETLVIRDRYTIGEAEQVLSTRYPGLLSREELEAMFARFPVRTSRKFVDESVLAGMPARQGDPEESTIQRDSDACASRVVPALRHALAQLPGEDRLIIRLHFQTSQSIAQIARMLRLDAKSLYRRHERLLQMLRQTMEAQGVTAEDLHSTLGSAMVAAVFEKEPPGPANSGAEVRPYPRGSGPDIQPARAE